MRANNPSASELISDYLAERQMWRITIPIVFVPRISWA